mgnify:CR=1 FL=1
MRVPFSCTEKITELNKLTSFEEKPLEKVANLTPRSRNINLRVRVLELHEPKVVFSRVTGEQHKVAEALVGDETGVVLMSLWNDTIDQVKVDDTLDIENARVTLFNNTMRLTLGREGNLKKSSVEISEDDVNKENNISLKRYEQRTRRW